VGLRIEQSPDKPTQLSRELIIERVNLNFATYFWYLDMGWTLDSHHIHRLNSLCYLITCMIHIFLQEIIYVIHYVSSVMNNCELFRSTKFALFVVCIFRKSLIKFGEQNFIVLIFHD